MVTHYGCINLGVLMVFQNKFMNGDIEFDYMHSVTINPFRQTVAIWKIKHKSNP
jgi:hypothetical protein